MCAGANFESNRMIVGFQPVFLLCNVNDQGFFVVFLALNIVIFVHNTTNHRQGNDCIFLKILYFLSMGMHILFIFSFIILRYGTITYENTAFTKFKETWIQLRYVAFICLVLSVSA